LVTSSKSYARKYKLLFFSEHSVHAKFHRSRFSSLGALYTYFLQDGFIHIAASGWISVNTEEKKNKHYIQKVKNQ